MRQCVRLPSLKHEGTLSKLWAAKGPQDESESRRVRPPSLKHRWLPHCERAKQYRATDPRTGGLQPKKCSTFHASLVPSGAETQEECKEVLPPILDIRNLRQLARLHKFESILSTQQHVKHLLLSFSSRLVAILQLIDASTHRVTNLTNKTS